MSRWLWSLLSNTNFSPPDGGIGQSRRLQPSFSSVGGGSTDDESLPLFEPAEVTDHTVVFSAAAIRAY
jgi:hypothetical protein